VFIALTHQKKKMV